jgi:hypothetical protein
MSKQSYSTKDTSDCASEIRIQMSNVEWWNVVRFARGYDEALAMFHRMTHSSRMHRSSEEIRPAVVYHSVTAECFSQQSAARSFKNRLEKGCGLRRAFVYRRPEYSFYAGQTSRFPPSVVHRLKPDRRAFRRRRDAMAHAHALSRPPTPWPRYLLINHFLNWNAASVCLLAGFTRVKLLAIERTHVRRFRVCKVRYSGRIHSFGFYANCRDVSSVCNAIIEWKWVFVHDYFAVGAR